MVWVGRNMFDREFAIGTKEYAMQIIRTVFSSRVALVAICILVGGLIGSKKS